MAKERALDTRKITGLVREYLNDQPDVMAAYLFGSLVTGAGGPQSDVDIALLFRPGLDKFVRFDRQLEVAMNLERLVLRKADVVDLRRAPPTLIHQILKTSEILLDRRPAQRKAFEISSRRVFMEMQPHYARRTKALLEKFRGGNCDGRP